MIRGLGDGRVEKGDVITDPNASNVPQVLIAVGAIDDDSTFDAAYATSSDIRVSLNNGNRSFSEPVPVAEQLVLQGLGAGLIGEFTGDDLSDLIVGDEPALVTGDFNEDGHVDLATRGEARILRGDEESLFLPSNATFGPGVLLSSPSSGAWVITDNYEFGTAGPVGADINNDGRTDLVVIDGDSDAIRILIGEGNGLFSGADPLALFPEGRSPVAVVADHFDDDGAIDLVVLNHATSNLLVLLSNP